MPRRGTAHLKYGKGFMAQIGKKGGKKTSQDIEHMKKIGSKGGKAERK